MRRYHATVLTVLAVIISLFITSCGNDPFFHSVIVIENGEKVSETIIYDADTFRLPEVKNTELKFEGWRVDGDSTVYKPGHEIQIFMDTAIRAVLSTDPPVIQIPRTNRKMSTLEKLTISAPEGSSVYYTTDGTDPTSESSSGCEVNLSSFSGEVTVKAIIIKSGVSSDVAEEKINVVNPPEKPILNDSIDSEFNQSDSLTVRTVSDTKLYYTSDGNNPTSASSEAKDGKIPLSGLSGKVTLKIVRVDSDGISSEVLTLENVKVKPSKPCLTDTEGNAVTSDKTFNDSSTLTIPEITGADVYYTTDGSEPGKSSTKGHSISLSGFIGSKTIKAVAVRDEVYSDVLTLNIKVKPAPFSYYSGSVKLEKDSILKQDAEITVDYAGTEKVYYSFDGATYSEAKDNKIKVAGKSGKTTVRAYADINGLDHDIVELDIIVCPKVPTTTLEENTTFAKTGTIDASLFTAADSTETLIFTLDGTEPDSSSDVIPGAGISLTGLSGDSVTVKVASVKDGAVSESVSRAVLLRDYSLTYNLDGASDPDKNTKTVYFNRGEEVKAAKGTNITKIGYSLDGWYTEANGGGTYYAFGTAVSTVEGKDIVLYAHWVDEDITISEDNVITGKSNVVNVEIPAVYHGKTVKLAQGAFKDNTSLTSVTFEKGTEKTEIPEDTFYGCSSLGNVTIPETVTTIGDSAFYGTAITSVTVPEKATTLGRSIFYGCTKLKTAVIKGSITSIPGSMFWNCSSLESVTLPATVTAIEDQAFGMCTKLTFDSLDLSRIKTIGYGVFYLCTGLEGEITLPELVTMDDIRTTGIDEKLSWAFYGCTKITAINLPKVKTIGREAFYGCTGLTSVTIGENVETVGNNAFSGCSSLKSKSVYIARNQKDSDTPTSWGIKDSEGIESSSTVVEWHKDYVMTFYDSDGKTKLETTRFNAGDNITMYGASKDGYYLDGWYKDTEWNTFYKEDKETVTSIEAPGEVGTEVKLYAHWIDSDVEVSGSSVKVNSSVTKTSVTGVEIPSVYHGTKLTSIPENGFRDCSALTSVTFEKAENMTALADWSFLGCTSLETIDLSKTGIKSLSMSCFYECTSLKTISLPDTLETIGSNAFRTCTSLKNIVIPATVNAIEGEAFYNAGLESITIPENVTSIGERCFQGNKALKSIVIKGKIKELKVSTFEGCTALTSVNLPDTLGIIESLAFQDCTALRAIDIPESITEIKDSAFSNCTDLTIKMGITRNQAKARKIPTNSKWKAVYNSTTVTWYRSPDERTVSFDLNGGSGTVEEQDITVGSYAAKPTVELTSKYQNFKFWSADGTTEFNFEKTQINENITLKAIWEDKYKVGGTGEAGGIIFYDAGSVKESTYVDSTGKEVKYSWRYMEATLEDYSKDGTSKFIFGFYRVGGNVENKTVGTSEEIGYGRSNTTKLVNAMGNYARTSNTGADTSSVYAAKICDDLSSGGYSDWFLPSYQEMEQMYKSKVVSNLTDAEHWTSSEDSGTHTIICNGYSNLGNWRYDKCLVRPVRAF